MAKRAGREVYRNVGMPDGTKRRVDMKQRADGSVVAEVRVRQGRKTRKTVCGTMLVGLHEFVPTGANGYLVQA